MPYPPLLRIGYPFLNIIKHLSKSSFSETVNFIDLSFIYPKQELIIEYNPNLSLPSAKKLFVLALNPQSPYLPFSKKTF